MNEPKLPPKPKLSPCPYCGGEASVQGFEIMPTYFIQCTNKKCGVMTPEFYSGKRIHAVTKAVKAWNRRREE